MAQETLTAPVSSRFSLCIPAEIRMTVVAEDAAEADEIMRAMFTDGWMKAMLDMGWTPPRTGIEFAVKLS